MDEKGKKRRYQPPQPDENTFATQELFFESLQPCSIESVAEHNRRCAHCWKRYGETDPGLDNAEQPVLLRCGHSFGLRCMQELFALPDIIKTCLIPLKFGSSSMGVKLARSLEKHLGTSAETEYPQLVGQLLAGMYMDTGDIDMDESWRVMLSSISPNLHILTIRLYENAIVYDIHESRKHIGFDALYFGTDPGAPPDSPEPLIEPEVSVNNETEVTNPTDVSSPDTQNERKKKWLISTLAPLIDELVSVYSHYKSFKCMPSSPPLECEPPDPNTAPEPMNRSLNIPTCVTIHKDDLGSGYHKVSIPYRHPVLGSTYGDDGVTENEPSSDTSDHFRPFFILCRQICASTCCFKEDHAMTKAREQMTGTVPTTIGWSKDKPTSNACPICSKVLYNRT